MFSLKIKKLRIFQPHVFSYVKMCICLCANMPVVMLLMSFWYSTDQLQMLIIFQNFRLETSHTNQTKALDLLFIIIFYKKIDIYCRTKERKGLNSKTGEKKIEKNCLSLHVKIANNTWLEKLTDMIFEIYGIF